MSGVGYYECIATPTAEWVMDCCSSPSPSVSPSLSPSPSVSPSPSPSVSPSPSPSVSPSLSPSPSTSPLPIPSYGLSVSATSPFTPPFPSPSDVPCGSGCIDPCQKLIFGGYCSITTEYVEEKCCPDGWNPNADPTGTGCTILESTEEVCRNSGGTVQVFPILPYPTGETACNAAGQDYRFAGRVTWHPAVSSIPCSEAPIMCLVTMASPLPTSGNDCYTCDITSNTFLNCYVSGFTGKLGLGASESSVTIDLIERIGDPCPVACSPAPSVCPSPSPACDPSNCTYSGRLGNIYTFQIGSFCFRGLLTTHNYSESEGGYKYSVTLTDGRSALSNVAVILNDLYLNVPDTMKPNIINAVYELEHSIGDDTCLSGGRCKDFMVSGGGPQKGMLVKRALEAIHNKLCQMPVSGSCLIIDVSRIIAIVSTVERVTSSDSNVLELISLACESSGYDFFIEIQDNKIVAVPINKKAPISDHDLYDFIHELSTDNLVSDRNYGQELTFSKNKKMVMGEQYHYLVVVDGGEERPGPTSSAMPAAGSCQNLGGCFNKITMAREWIYSTQGSCEEGQWVDYQPPENIMPRHFVAYDPANPVTDRIWFIPANGTNYGPGSWAYDRFLYDPILNPVVDDPYHVTHTIPINASPVPSPNSCLP